MTGAESHRSALSGRWIGWLAAALVVSQLFLLGLFWLEGTIGTLPGGLLLVGMITCSAAAVAFFGIRQSAAKREIERISATLSDAVRKAGGEGNSLRLGSYDGKERDDALADLEASCDAAIRTIRSLAVACEQSRDLVRNENEAKVKFFGAMSHELRTPLNAILGYAGLLIEDAEERGEAETTSDLLKIASAGRRLLDLINNLLELSGIQSEKSTSVKMLVPLEELLAEANSQVSGAGNPVVLEPLGHETEDVMLHTNRDKAVRVISILFDTARSFSSSRPRVSTRCDIEMGEISIEIACPGWEVAPTDTDKMFAGPGEQTGKLDDHGLVALALARSRSRILGGECSAAHDAEGTLVLKFALPVGIKNLDRRDPVSQDEAETTVIDFDSGDPIEALERRTVLVIDDDAAAIDLLRRWLQRLGCRVLEASNAYDGIELAKNAKPDLVLLDALMPGRSGYDLLMEMRASASMRDLPVVLVTVDDDRDRGLDAGASDFIRKPISESQLRQVVQTYDASAKGRILVVDDDEDAAEIMCRNLERIGFVSQRAADGEQGLKAAREDLPSAIVLDLRMPNLDGFTFIERLAQDDVLASVPVIVVSGHDLSLPQHHLLAKAGYHFFSKGRTAPREIADTLRELVA